MDNHQVVATLNTSGATFAAQRSGDALSEITLAPFDVQVLFRSSVG